jgi:archaeosine-15-forming tRNA-guanine transglycosylase
MSCTPQRPIARDRHWLLRERQRILRDNTTRNRDVLRDGRQIAPIRARDRPPGRVGAATAKEVRPAIFEEVVARSSEPSAARGPSRGGLALPWQGVML